MKYRISLAVVLCLAIGVGVARGRAVQLWSYSDLTEKSDLIIIGTHKKSTDSTTKKKVCGVPIVGIDSTFSVLSVLKGRLPKKTIEVYHYRYDYDNVQGITNGLSLVHFCDDDKNS